MKKLLAIVALTTLSSSVFAFNMCDRCMYNCMNHGYTQNDCLYFNCAPQCGTRSVKTAFDLDDYTGSFDDCVNYYVRTDTMSLQEAENFCADDGGWSEEFDEYRD